MRARRDQEFEEWVRDHRGTLLRTATALTGGDAHHAEDLVQSTLVRLYSAWPRARRMHITPYARRILLNALIDDKRRLVNRREEAWPEPPEVPVLDESLGTVNERLLAALATLPAGIRAAVVLRHVEGLSVDEAADAMGTTAGAVRTQTSRGLDRLRLVLDLTDEPTPTKGQLA